MRPFYSAHGKHCYLRSFQVKCPKCNAEVLYWECIHGCKVFFEYPPYGKLIKHICQRYRSKKHENKYTIFVKKPKRLLEAASPSCPICGKLFKTENDVNEHLTQVGKTDLLHKKFLERNFLFDSSLQENIQKLNAKPKFGRINIKKRNL